jgi:DNA-binding CsgD family transcriptional regulator
MSLQPSRDTLFSLARVIHIASTPFEYGRLDDWRAELLGASIALLDSERGHFDVFGMGLENDSLFVGYPASVFDEWWTEWAVRDPALPFMETARLTAYSRRYRYRVAGEYWTARYKRSAIHREFYRKHRLADAAGLFLRCGPVTAHLHVETGQLTDDEDDRARRLITVVEPALRAALQTLGSTQESSRSPFAVLDALAEPIGVIAPTGRWLHRSRAFNDLLAILPEPRRTEVVAELERRAVQFLDDLAGLQATHTPSKSPVPLWTIDVLSASATAIDLSTQSGRSCLVRLQARSGVTLGQTAAMGLSRRERDVAILLAEGLANKRIAERLAISEHTVRRHSERIFRKLGVANRGSVASALRNAGRDAST